MNDLIARTLELAQELWPGASETTRTFDWEDGQPVLTLMFAHMPEWTDSAISVYLYAGRWVAEELWCLGEPHFAYASCRRGDIDVPMSVVREALQYA
mgnify:FL=1